MIGRADGGRNEGNPGVAEIMRRDQALAEAPESIRLINAAKSDASGSHNWRGCVH
jgi:hypothetical protein